ncbi:hypothetical protein MBAV_004688 [Candidatus Magnetobacterium bavaricum]|uniref:Uncharacterized protein n=1 Tax=Candidatus Magnetobacterium bavaricum TaxID=29290 RepID=A0A0F3GMB2_9BACT|nr:hypothetical protein MBAV_004688 [Candidatus Magnetobacterium bavaricum]
MASAIIFFSTSPSADARARTNVVIRISAIPCLTVSSKPNNSNTSGSIMNIPQTVVFQLWMRNCMIFSDMSTLLLQHQPYGLFAPLVVSGEVQQWLSHSLPPHCSRI